MNRALTLHRVRPVVDRTFPFDQAREALEHLRKASHFGKIVLAARSSLFARGPVAGTSVLGHRSRVGHFEVGDRDLSITYAGPMSALFSAMSDDAPMNIGVPLLPLSASSRPYFCTAFKMVTYRRRKECAVGS